MTVCINLLNVINYKRLNKELHTNFSMKNYEVNLNMSNLSVRTLFDYTPSTDSILESFYHKSTEESKPIYVNKNITDHVDITKFFQRSNVCYQIAFKRREKLSYREISVTNYYQYVVSELYFNRVVENCTEIKLMISPVDHLPYKEVMSTDYVLRRLYTDNGTAAVDTNRYTSTHMTVEKVTLPSPYETHCIRYPDFHFTNQNQCIDDCIASLTRDTFGKVNILFPVTQSTDLPPFSRDSLKDKSNYLKFSRNEKFCQEKQCKNRNCYDTEIVTSTVSRLKNSKRKFSWTHKVVSHISFRIISTVSLPFFEFVIYILGSISTWTGLSVIACNPIALRKQLFSRLDPRPSAKLGAKPHNECQKSRATEGRQLRRIFHEPRTRQHKWTVNTSGGLPRIAWSSLMLFSDQRYASNRTFRT